MALSTRLTARQTQTLTMTPQLRQAIELLQMSSLELQRFINEEVEKNPLLESDTAVLEVTDLDQSMVKETPAARPIERLLSERTSGDPYDPTENLANPTSMRQHLIQQLSVVDADPDLVILAKVLAHELEDDGYLRTSMKDIAERLGESEAQMCEALELLQDCEPTGVAARSLAECFALQLKERGALDDKTEQFLDLIEKIAESPSKMIWTELGLSADDYADLLTRIRSLNAAPGGAFEQGYTEYAIPDVSVFRNNLGGWSVELNKSTLPAVTVDTALAEKVRGAGPEEKKFISGCSRRADWLLKSIEQRSSTILKVAAEIVRVQEAFFTLGVSHLRPLTMRAVADKVKINESTVSRVANSKYLSCERGTFELKFFFSKEIRGTNGNAGQSSVSVQQKIKSMIEAEASSAILSDDKIVKILNESGVDIARRTVTKYREGMNIPSSVERRRVRANLDKIR